MTRKLEFVMEGDSEPDEAQTETKAETKTSRVITSFDQLRQMKSRCRLPVDIMSEQDHFSQPSICIEKKKYFSFLQTNKNFVNKITESVCSTTSSGYSSTSSSPSMSPSYQHDLSIVENKQIQFKEKKSKGRHSIDSSCLTRQAKILTVLFDYESKGKEILGNRVVFAVKKGQLVKVLRDYDKNFHLVAKCSDNSIGFLPKDYTVDLVEVKNKVLKNSHIAAEKVNYLASSRLSFSSKNRTNRNYENSNNPLFKLTKL